MGGSGKKITQAAITGMEQNAPPAKAEKAAAEGVAKEMARRDALAKAQQAESVTVTAPTPTPASTPSTAPATPTAPPAEPVAQQMVNATPVKGAGMNSNVVAAANPAALPGAMKATSGPAVGAGASAAPRQAAAAAAQQANQTSSGANQFMAPNINGLTFGGS